MTVRIVKPIPETRLICARILALLFNRSSCLVRSTAMTWKSLSFRTSSMMPRRGSLQARFHGLPAPTVEAEKMVREGQHFCKNQRTIDESMAFFMQASRIAPLDLSMLRQSSGTCVFANGEAASLARSKLQTGLVCTGWQEKGSSSP